eukprot:TRINITY_DN7067_c0_g1_i3.p1 TRINITY_DN7067_c0_g1~~TRINITY_DN7067_c0_g1_i3.p1  ORF type:complete len:718 (-),score=105.72 TRINITY_DN7067_c0_g1_i3:429-2582(-)
MSWTLFRMLSSSARTPRTRAGTLRAGVAWWRSRSPPKCATETGALFPRLHVKETNKVGPRAPPRNKMALYEQFTIPSHRFMTSSLPIPSPARTAGSAPQHAIYDRRYFYPQSTMSYSSMTAARQCVGQPSLGSSASTVVDCDELQRVPGVSQVESSAPSVVSARGNPAPTSSARHHKHAVGKKHRIEDDFTVPTYSAPQMSKRVTVLSGGKSVRKRMQECVQGGVSCPTRLVPGDETICKGIIPGTIDVQGATTSVIEKDQAEQLKEGSSKQNVDGLHDPNGRGDVPVIAIQGQNLPSDSSWKDGQLLYGADCQVHSLYYDFRKNVAPQTSLPGVVSSTGSDECVTACRENVFVDRQAISERECDLAITKSTALETRQSHLSDFRSGDAFACLQKPSTHVQEFEDRQECKERSFESSGDSEHHPSSSSGQIFEPLQVARSIGDDSDSSMVDSVPIQRISPRDVIGAIGQQEFWRTRKAILRQQRIFSVQIFELHRLVKVQQLMAMSPTSEYVVSRSCSGFVAANPVGKASGQDKVLKGGSCDGDQESRKSAGDTECPTGKMCSSKDVTGSVSLESHAQICQGTGPQTSGFVPPMTSTWGYPPYLGVGVHPWLGAVSARSGALMYHYPSSFAPNPAVLLGAYGPYRPVANASNHLDVYPLPLFPMEPVINSGANSQERFMQIAGESQGTVVKIAPRAVVATPESAAGILLSIQQERRR